MIYLIFIIFGLVPSIVWLLFYLKKDSHPESKKMVLKIFFYGMVSGLIALAIGIWLSWSITFFGGKYIANFPLLFFFINQFIIIALVEESSKFLIVKEKVINNKEFDEPVDAMVYMIISALGFAALENVLVLFSLGQTTVVRDVAIISSFRFLGATFLHALASGTVGYFLALSICDSKNRLKLIAKGLIIASILHGVFNISIGIIEKGLVEQNMPLFIISFSFLIILLGGTAIFISSRFKKLKKLLSTCHPFRQDKDEEPSFFK